MTKLLRIGEFARLGGVSIKALRFYDEQKLLQPEHVDSQTGYRYYSVGQTETLSKITNLRSAGFSIAEISSLIGAGFNQTVFNKAVAEKRRELQRVRTDIEGKLKIVDALAQTVLNNAPEAVSKFKLTAIAPQLAHSAPRRVAHLGAPVTEIFETAEANVSKHNARAAEPPFMIFHDAPVKKQDLQVEICIPVTHALEAGLETKIIDGSAFACGVVYGGGYDKTNALHEQMTEWITSAGLKPAGPLREIYHRFGADQEDYRLPAKVLAKRTRDFLTELKIPIAP